MSSSSTCSSSRSAAAATILGAAAPRPLAAAARPCTGHGQRRQRTPQVAPMAGNWKVFGPTAEYSDGDAEFFRLTSQLSDQYEWFAPREQEPQQQPFGSPDEDEELLSTQRQGRVARPEFGMTPREIAALGLTGPQHGAPDPVRVAVFCVQRVRACACVFVVSRKRRLRATMARVPAADAALLLANGRCPATQPAQAS